MSKIGIILLAILFGPTVYSQDYKADIDQIITRLDQNESYRISSTIRMYDNAESRSLSLSFEATTIGSSLGYRSRIGDTEVISNQKMVVLVDHEEQLIQVENQEKINKKDGKLLAEIKQLRVRDSLLISSKLISHKSGIKTYELRMKGDIVKAIITIDMNKLALKEIKYFYNETTYPTGNYVEIEYHEFDANYEVEEDLIKASDIIEKSGKTFKVLSKYKGYQLMNLYFD